jgi:predicted transcriptional regulator
MKKRASRPSLRKTQGQAVQKPVALTVKIDSDTYVRLSILRAKERKTTQEILSHALRQYLDRVGA